MGGKFITLFNMERKIKMSEIAKRILVLSFYGRVTETHVYHLPEDRCKNFPTRCKTFSDILRSFNSTLVTRDGYNLVAEDLSFASFFYSPTIERIKEVKVR